MSFDKTTIGGWAMAIGIALGTGLQTLPSTGYESIKVPLTAVAAVLATLGAVLLGTYSSEASKTVTLDQMQDAAKRSGPNAPLTPSMFVDPGPPPEKKEAPDSSKL